MNAALADIWNALNVWNVGLFVSACVIAVFIYNASRYENRQFHFGEFFMEDGKTSLKNVAAMGAFFVSSWVVLHQEANARLSMEIFGMYMFGWVFAYTAPKFVDKWRSGSTGQPQQGGK